MRGYIKQRAKGSWSISIYIGKDNITNKKKYKWYTVRGTKKEAEKFLNEKINEVEKGIYIDSKNMSLCEYLNYWYNQKCLPNLAPTTYESYRRNIDKYIIPHLGNIKLQNLLPLQLQSFYSELSKKLSNTTLIYIHRIIHSALKQAMKWQLVIRNVADNVEIPKKEKYHATVLDSLQLTMLINAVKNTYIYIPVMIAISTGMRRGEVLGLTWNNVNLNNATLNVVNSLVPTQDGLKLLPPKTETSIRKISLSPTLVEILKKHKAKNYSSDFVCTLEDGRLISPSSLNHKFKDIIKENNLPNIRFHDLRHSHASLLLSQGVQPKMISERLGHSNISITMDLYSHIYEADNAEIANNFDEFLKNA